MSYDRIANEKLLMGEINEITHPPKQHKLISKFITACGNFSVQYNFQAIAVALLIMSASQCTTNDDSCKEGEQAEWVHSSATATVFIGAIIGQLTMGYAGDILGRNAAMTFTLSLVGVSALASALFPMGEPTTVYVAIIVARFFLGIGVGGVYPLSATKAAEDGGDAHGNVDPSAASWAFFWQVPGTMTPWLLALIFSYCDNLAINMRWRLILGLGAIPAFAVVICSVIESYDTSHSEHKGNKNNTANIDSIEKRHQSLIIHDMLKQSDTWKKLAVTGGGWFIYDVAYYGVNLFGGDILKSISDSDDDSVSSSHSIRKVTQQQFIALGMGLPACVLAIYSLKLMSTKTLQCVGFVFIALMFILLASCFDALEGNALFAIYCLLLFSLSFGPNLTTFILPAETFPKEVRATFNGISAACGKLGAFTGVYMFGPLADKTSYPVVMIVCAIISIGGLLVTYYFIPNDVITAEERFRVNSRDDRRSTGGISSSAQGLLNHNEYIYE